jgi:predicted nucleic acid-binding protein
MWDLANSEAVDLELLKMTNPANLRKVRSLYAAASGERLRITDEVLARALSFQQKGLKQYDSLHLALAELSQMDVLLTTDDGFLKAAGRIETDLLVANPVAWLMEVIKNER